MRKFNCTMSTEELERLYIKEGRTLKEMCPIVGVKNCITMSKILRSRGISTNNNQRLVAKTMGGMSDEEFRSFLEKKYASGMSMREIADIIGITPSGVRKYFLKYGIERRSNSGYASVDPTYSVNWNGGRHVASNGYVEIKVKGHPRQNKRGYVYEHQFVMEQHIGRLLKKGEVVHHIDGNKQNNDISNLMLLTNEEHAKLHSLMRRSEKRKARG